MPRQNLLDHWHEKFLGTFTDPDAGETEWAHWLDLASGHHPSPIVYIGNVGAIRQQAIMFLMKWRNMVAVSKNVSGNLKWRNPRPGIRWSLDNGAFGAWDKTSPMTREQFNGALFLQALERARCVEPHPDFVVIPDLIGSGSRSLAFSMEWLHETLLPDFPELTYYLAVQDGLLPKDITNMGGIAGIFVGGSAEWKERTGHFWARWAHAEGLPCHIGRVGTGDKIMWAKSVGADSVDSTNWVQTVKWAEKFAMLREMPKHHPTRYLCESCLIGMHGICSDPECKCVCFHTPSARPVVSAPQLEARQRSLGEFPRKAALEGKFGRIQGYRVQWTDMEKDGVYHLRFTRPAPSQVRDGRIHPMIFQPHLEYTLKGKTQNKIELWDLEKYVDEMSGDPLIGWIATSDWSDSERYLVGWLYLDQSWVLGEDFPLTHRGPSSASPFKFMGPFIEEWKKRVEKVK